MKLPTGLAQIESTLLFYELEPFYEVSVTTENTAVL